MTRRKLAKAKSPDPGQFLPVRSRPFVFCPFCGHKRKISWFTKLMARDLHPFTCASCEIVFLIPMQTQFDPTNLISIEVDSKRGLVCKSCRVAFRASHCYEQCPMCGQAIFVAIEPGAKGLIDNSKDFLQMLEDARNRSEI